MIQRWTVLLGVFVIMALSNAIVPILPHLAAGAALQSAIFSAYFLGAFVTVLPAGVLSDRIGQVPLIRAGLLLTIASGLAIVLFPAGLIILLARAIEGIAAGLFVASALAWTNTQQDHDRLSGRFMAALNIGLLLGLLGAGWLEALTQHLLAGVALFTALAFVPGVLSIFLAEAAAEERPVADLARTVGNYIWLFLSAVVLVGVTGAITAIYPEYTGRDPALLSMQIGAMNAATIVAVLVASRAKLPPVETIRAAALLMAAAVVGCYFSPVAFPVIGGLAGFVIIAQLAFLAQTGVRQGTLTGLFNTSTYGGMAMLPMLAGVLADTTGFFSAFAILSIIVGSMALAIGRCRCRGGV